MLGWNGSPRDGTGARGAWEEALVGTPLADPLRPLEILRTVHSFDPCMGCSVHVHDPAGGDGLLIEIARKLGYRLIDHRLELYGVPLTEDEKVEGLQMIEDFKREVLR